jgi:hypothetical protein
MLDDSITREQNLVALDVCLWRIAAKLRRKNAQQMSAPFRIRVHEPATLISITAINVLSCSRAVRDLLESKDCDMGALLR